MSLLRETPDFAALLRTAAADLRVPAALVEKDYWLAQVLRVLAKRHYGQFILKGGTSLSKGYRLLERFSEDVDILLLPHQSDRRPDGVEALLAAVEASLADSLPGPIDARTADEGVARVLTVGFIAQQPALEGLAPFVRVDYGVGGGSIPQDDVSITTLVGDRLVAAGLETRGFEDLEPFRLPVLHPARTLLEKLCIVHGLAVRIAGDNPYVRSREARHYYDLWHLLDEERSPALRWIDGHGDIGPLVDDCVRFTRDHDGSEPPIPDEGIADGPAFTDPEVLDRVGTAYVRMLKALAFPGRRHPSLDDVRERVRAQASRLRVAAHG